MYINCLAIIKCSEWVPIIVMVGRFTQMRANKVVYSYSKRVLGTCRAKQVFECKVLKIHWQRTSTMDFDCFYNKNHRQRAVVRPWTEQSNA